MSRTAAADLDGTARPEHRWRISAWLHENPGSLLTTIAVRHALESARPSLGERANRMVRWLAGNVPPGRYFDLHTLGRSRGDTAETFSLKALVAQPQLQPLVPIGWNRDEAETCHMINEFLWHELGYLFAQAGLFNLTAKGLLSLEGIANKTAAIGFCAMWFAPEMRFLYEQLFAPAIRNCGFEPLRVDGREHNGKIDDEIVASIRRARFVVADFSGHRSGVYYEAGFAHGLGLPVIFTCRDTDLQNLHFDVRQYNTIDWNQSHLGDASERLTNRILATIGQGPMAASNTPTN